MTKIEKLLKKYDDSSPVDKRFERAEPEIERLSDKAQIPEVAKETAKIIYRKALEKDLVRGRSIAAVAVVSVYAACHKSGIIRTLDEIANLSLADKRDVGCCYRVLIREHVIDRPEIDLFTYFSKIAENAGISRGSQEGALNILKEVKKRGLDKNKSPVGLDAAAFYISCLQNNEKKTQRDIAEAAGTTEVTVRTRYKTLKEQLGLDI